MGCSFDTLHLTPEKVNVMIDGTSKSHFSFTLLKLCFLVISLVKLKKNYKIDFFIFIAISELHGLQKCQQENL